jgi:CxxC motif-containing protein (DUF1111 family)
VLGRFGWKATKPAPAVGRRLNGDMGITSPLFPVESCAGQPGQDDGLADDAEIDDEVLDVTTFYVQTLGVPARRNTRDPVVQQGARLFEERAALLPRRP